jgi:RNA polymerase sigma-70 factor (ECF subfamily)
MTDGELVRQTLDGNRAACDALVRRWAGRVLAFCQARVANRQLAEDLAQEALLRGIRGLPSLDSPDKFGTWICGIAVRVCSDWRKARQSSQVPFTTLRAAAPPDDLAATDADATEGAVDRADDVRQLMDEVARLPEKHREVLLLFYQQDATYQELANLLGVSTATINARLTQARAMLRERMSHLRS